MERVPVGVVAVVAYERSTDLDSGWRIDHQFAPVGLAALAVKAEVDRAPSYAERWSDHVPVVVDDDLTVHSVVRE